MPEQEMSKEDVAARDDAGHWALGEPSGSSNEATPIGVARSATSWTTVGIAGEVMPRELFSTPLVRPYGSGFRTGLRNEVGEDLPSSSQHFMLAKLSKSLGVGSAAVAAS